MNWHYFTAVRAWMAFASLIAFVAKPTIAQTAGARSSPLVATPAPVIATPAAEDSIIESVAGGSTSQFVIQQITNTPTGDTQVSAMTSDGRYLLLSSTADLVPPQNSDGNRELFLYDRSEGVVEQLTDTIGSSVIRGMSMTDDAMKMAFTSRLDLDNSGDTIRDDLFLIDRISGLQRLTFEENVWGASFNADGSRLVVSSGGGLDPLGDNGMDAYDEIFLYEGAGFQQLTDSDWPAWGYSRSPAISADGTRVAFTSDSSAFIPNSEHNTELVRLMLATGQFTSTVTPGICPGGQSCTSEFPAISADGRQIAFRSNANHDTQIGNADGNFELFMVRPETPGVDRVAQQTQATGTPVAPRVDRVAMNRNGTKLAFFSNQYDASSNPDGNYELRFLNPTPPNLLMAKRQVTVSTGGDSPPESDNVHISADGGLIVFTSTRDLNPSVGNADGSREAFLARPVNPPPLLATIGNTKGVVGQPLTFTVAGTDPDADPLNFYALDIPTGFGATFTNNGDGTATFNWPSPVDSTSFATVVVTDDDTIQDAQDAGTTWSDSESFYILITENQPPVLVPIADQSTSEGALLAFSVTATDPNGPNQDFPNGQVLTLTVTNAPEGANFVDNGDGTGLFSWTPACDQAGVHSNVTFTADDGLVQDSETIAITATEALSCPLPPGIPALSGRGVVAMTFLLLAAGTLVIRHRFSTKEVSCPAK